MSETYVGGNYYKTSDELVSSCCDAEVYYKDDPSVAMVNIFCAKCRYRDDHPKDKPL